MRWLAHCQHPAGGGKQKTTKKRTAEATEKAVKEIEEEDTEKSTEAKEREILSKQVLKLSRQMATVRASTLVCWMCRDRDGLITATKDQTRDYAVAYADAVEIAAKEKMGPMRLRVLEKLCSYFLKWWEDYQELPMEGIRDPAIAALKEFVSKARTKVWAQLHMEVPVLRAAKAWTQGTIKIEYSVTPGTDAAELFQKVVYPYLRKQGHRQMIGVEPK